MSPRLGLAQICLAGVSAAIAALRARRPASGGAVFSREELATLISDARVPQDRRVLYALASIGWCKIADDGIVQAADGFNYDNARSFRSLALWWGCYRWAVWCDLLHSVRTGKSAVGNGTGRIAAKQAEIGE